MAATTHRLECTANPETLYAAFDLGNRRWTVASTSGVGAAVRHKEIPAIDAGALAEELRRAKAKFGLAADARVRTCYEAGRDGFAPHRLLTQLGVENLVVDASSIEVPRRLRRAKTDRLDAAKLLPLLVHYDQGERERLRVVRVPSVETEDRRQLHRELKTAQGDRQRGRNRITSLVAAQGGRIRLDAAFPTKLSTLVLPDGRPLPPELVARLRHEWDLLTVFDTRVTALEAERHRRVVEAPADDREIARVHQLARLRAIGEATAWVLVFEYFWRTFGNRRQVAAGAGLTPTPFASGDLVREQGIGKAGNARVRTLMVEVGWSWLRWQPHSELSQWFDAHFASTKRARRIGVVALARRLLIALWRYLETGELPAGAVVKA